ncbi:HlyD family efflux transporter periplasmic adaptor subunit [Synechococcus sp. UW140]|uniref:HlyD family efflux transporter periplasmic adaptor subunit n=1 Tax=Synechococcus sp. UW140 TaxID=368503 RepID=UPI0025F8FF95|nr:HlyD family efflux transporter periplasmic adaptor subunit [Synechococcus sp. UW140]
MEPQEVLLKPAALWSKALAWTIIGSASFGFLFACFAKIDEVVLAQGELQPLGADRPIKAPFAGVVKEILVKEGQKVKAGDSLLRLDAQVSKNRAETLSKQLKLENSRFNEESRSIQAREQSLRERMDGLIRTKKTELEIYTDILPLGKSGGIQRMQLLQQKNRVEQLESEIAQSRANLLEVQAQLMKMKQESLREITDLERQLVEIKDTLEKEILKAPLDGVVFGLVPSSPGYAAASGETLVKVVPGGVLEAKVYITNRDVGFLKKGMVAQVRVDAFPYTQFGDIPGELKSVGTLPIQPDQQNPTPRFPAYILLKKDYVTRDGNRFAISAGQSVQANLVLRDKRVISLLTDAVQKALDSLRSIRSES